MVNMQPGPDEKMRESATLAELFEAASARQRTAREKTPLPPRFLLEGARSMAAHMGMSDPQMQDRLERMALWQLYLPAALGGRAWDFAAVRQHFPSTFARLRETFAALEERPQIVGLLYHMAGYPLVTAAIGAVWRELHDGPLHYLVAGRNTGWLNMPNNRWIRENVVVLDTRPAGLRALVSGLGDGSIRRLLVMVDGPQQPGTPGTRTLAGVSMTLGFRTTLLARIHALGIPLVPVVHEWSAGRLIVTPRTPIEPAVLGPEAAIDAVADTLEDLLRRRPEQWLNWNAAGIRT